MTEQELKDLRADVDFLLQKRITQVDIVPAVIKTRHMGEANLWVRGGLEADRPTIGEGTTNGYALYFAYDTNKIWVWNKDAATPAWKYASLS